MFAKKIVGSVIVGLGILCMVLPKTVIALPQYKHDEEFIEIDYIGGETAYQNWLTKKKIPYNSGSCVLYAKSLTGFNEPVGAARNWPKNAKEAVAGGVVITSEGIYGHTAVITRVWADGFEVTEANYIPNKVTTRKISKDYEAISGFWSKVGNDKLR